METKKRTGFGLKSFKQQRLRAWQPLLTPYSVIPSFFFIGMFFVPIGAILLITSSRVVETEPVRYDMDASSSQCSKVPVNCTIPIVVEEDMESPVYFYYQLTSFYQNHRRYVRSRDDGQLKGKEKDDVDDLGDCDPLRTSDDSDHDSKILVPCGLVANSFFTDKFSLYRNGISIPWRKDGIAWGSDLRSKFKNPSQSYIDNHVAAPGFTSMEDEDFVVWMRTAGLPTFRKLYRIIDEKLDAGTYYLNIESLYDVSSWDGTKSVLLSTTTWTGGRNLFLGWSYIAVGALCIIAALAFIVLHKIYPRSIGDPQLVAFSLSK